MGDTQENIESFDRPKTQEASPRSKHAENIKLPEKISPLAALGALNQDTPAVNDRIDLLNLAGIKDIGVKPPDQGEPGKELDQGINEYRRVLSSCFDENGNFNSRIKEGKYLGTYIWQGENVSGELLREPEATYYQEVMLGLRPLVFVGDKDIFLRPGFVDTQKFFEEEGIGLNTYVHEFNKKRLSPNIAVYKPEAVKKVVEENKDVFDNYDPGEPIDSYLEKALRWDALADLWNRQNPLEVTTSFVSSVKEEKVHGFRGAKWREVPADVPRTQALRAGLLMGFPRDLLEKAIARKIIEMEIRKKVTERHNDLMESSEEYRQWLGNLNTPDTTNRDYRTTEDGLLIASQYEDVFPDLTDDERAFLKRQNRYFFNDQTAHSPTPEIGEFNNRILDKVEQSGIKDVQKEYAQKYRAIKMKGLAGVMKKMLRVKTKV